MKKSGDLYFRFLNLVNALDDDSFLGNDLLSRKVLENICLHVHSTKEYLTVSEIILLNKLGSPATLHSRIKKLTKSGYIELQVQADARVKKVIPTQKAWEYFESINQNLVTILKENH